MNFVPIRLSTLRPGLDLDFDLHVRLKAKYLLYVRQGDDISDSRLKNLRKKKVKQLFISDTDEEKYQQFLDRSLSNAAEDPNMPVDEKANIANGVAAGAAEDMHNDPNDPGAYRMCERATEGLINIVGNNPDILKHVFTRALAADQEKSIAHAVTTSSLCVRLGRVIGMSNKQLRNLGTAGLLHDIGLSKLPLKQQELLFKPYNQFTAEDWKVYKPHPKSGAHLLNGKAYINEQILDLISIHEERTTGEGFPDALTNLTLIQEVIALASCYSRKVTCLNMTHKDALKDFQVTEVGKFDLNLLNKFQEIMREEGIGD